MLRQDVPKGAVRCPRPCDDSNLLGRGLLGIPDSHRSCPRPVSPADSAHSLEKVGLSGHCAVGPRERAARPLRPRTRAGRGGMATVYLAQDVKHDRKVALKVLHPELAATPGTDVQELHSGPVHRTGNATPSKRGRGSPSCVPRARRKRRSPAAPPSAAESESASRS